MMLKSQLSASRLSVRAAPTSRRALLCKAFQEGEVKTAASSSGSSSTSSDSPSQLKPVLDFFASEQVKLGDLTKPITDSSIYKDKLATYVESPVMADALGWKALPETINGRLAMLGFAAGALAELLGAGSLLQQFAFAPQPVVLTLVLLTVASVVPIVKATKGDYLASLRDTYSLPDGVFTEVNERIYGRLAMLGLGSLLLIELFTGRALL